MAKYFKYTNEKPVSYIAQGMEPNSISFDFQTKQVHIAFDEVQKVGLDIVVVAEDKLVTLDLNETLALFTAAQLTLIRDKAVEGVLVRTGDTGADEA